MKKAVLTLYGEKEAKTVINVLFNPDEYSISRSVNYAELEAPGLDSPIIQYISGKATELKLTLHVDTLNDFVPPGTPPDVREQTGAIARALWIDGKLHAPPQISFSWGSFFMRGVLTNLSQSFTMFCAEGTPVRAKLDLTIRQTVNNPQARRFSPFESPDRTKARLPEPGGALWRLAHDEYGSAEYWRVIAAANGICNPRYVPHGKVLRLPPLTR